MNCKDSKKYIYQMLDGEATEAVEAELTLHMEGCSACQGELKSLKALHRILKSNPATIEPSKGFEQVFWQKVFEREKEPWFSRLLKDFESLMRAFNSKQAVGFMLLAFFIGNIGGIVWEFGQGTSAAASPASIRHFSHLQEFKGVPSYSLTATYLNTFKTEISE